MVFLHFLLILVSRFKPGKIRAGGIVRLA
ncbi:hypothetical protein RDI58_017664 [Solanum bulbocastanum]|uniref:Uncharacterized protein n=1 Tax=Solanum bulbocastanum TaxID=147425 RepID=A0AAN8Y921_SOLBU